MSIAAGGDGIQMLHKEASSSAQQTLIDRLAVGSTLLKVSNGGKLSRVSVTIYFGSSSLNFFNVWRLLNIFAEARVTISRSKFCQMAAVC
jgi:hypothetical protein